MRTLCSLILVTLSLFTTPAATAAEGDLTSGVVRINGKRFKKVMSGTSALYIPSQGLAVNAALPEAVCPGSLSAKDEVLEISKPAPADDEIKAVTKEILAQMDTCKGATSADAKAAAKADDCDGSAVDPKLDAKGQVAEGTGGLKFGCKKSFGK